MADGDPGSLRPASAYSTGGGGFTFERKAAVRYLSAMLSGASRPELGDRRVIRVVFQQPQVAPFDDLQVLAAREDEDQPSLELWVAVRRVTKFTRSDRESQRVIGALIEAVRIPKTSRRERILVLCAAAGHNPTSQVAELSALARNLNSEDSFRAQIAENGRVRAALRKRFSHLESLVRDYGLEGHEISVWELLRQLHVSQIRVEATDEIDWAALQDELKPWSHEQTLAGAMDLRSRLADLAAQYAPDGAEVDRSRLCKDAHSTLHSDRRLSEAAWGELERLQQEARSAVRSFCGSDSPVTLPRREARDKLSNALKSVGVLLVTGDSGVGKSALVCSALDHLCEEDNEFEAVYVNLRHLPPRPSDLRSSLGAPLDRVLGEMPTARRLLVIDSADQSAETPDTPLAAILGDALRADVAVCVVTADTGRGAVESIVDGVTAMPLQRFVVTGLSDTEVFRLAGHFPTLAQVSRDSRARELLRRPVVADLLARAGGDGVPLSMSAAMEQIWAGLIRKDGKHAKGSPDSREQAMRQLAQQHLTGEDPESAYAALDGEALEGLRRDGIVRTSSESWSPLPEFAHDILRVFAVAKVLGADGTPAKKLVGFGAPRWALPAARLAFQSLLHHRDESGATLQSLQESCQTLVVPGKGTRWGDIPVEAALGLPDWEKILTESWEWLAADSGAGLKRVFRLVSHRHTSTHIAEPGVAGPIASLLVNRWWPEGLQSQVEESLGSWLRGLVSHRIPFGNDARIQLREAIGHKVALGDQREQRQAEEQAARLAARTPEQIEEDEARIRISQLRSIFEPPRRERDRLPFELTDESTLGLLSLLGPDLGPEGEHLLRRVAANAPERLQAVVEAPLAGESLAQHNHSLLVELVEAYYIDEVHTHYRTDAFEDGIRRHIFAGLGVPQAGPLRGPFLAMFRHDFPAGVACLNRILNHAARAQVRPRIRSPLGLPPPASADLPGVVLSISGEPRNYVGNQATWLWYRIIAAGPYPCTSALQALEVICNQILEKEQLSPDVLSAILLDGCENLAMPALIFGLMVRHLDRFERLIDPYLVEPFVWDAETSRVVQERSGFARGSADSTEVDRRNWTPLEAVVSLVVSADEDRQQELVDMGSTLYQRSRAGLKGSPREKGELAVARRRMLAFNFAQYESELAETGDAVRVTFREDEEVQAALAESNAELTRGMEADHLQFRYADRFITRTNSESPNVKQLARDIDTAKTLLSDPPPGSVFEESAAPAAVAAAVLEGFFLDNLALGEEDLSWAARTLADIARFHKQQQAGHAGVSDTAIFPWGADRSAARGLPLLLRPDARPVLDRLTLEGLDEHELNRILDWLFTASSNETRNAAARALDSVWRSPCSTAGMCFHKTALDLVEQSVRHAAFQRGQFDELDEFGPLVGPIMEALVSADNIDISLLNPALRALGAEALTPVPCIHDQAAEMLDATLEAHRRIRCSVDIGWQNSDWDALFAARAVLARATAGNPTALQDHVLGFGSHFEGLRECLLALAAAAEESPEAATAASAAWPQLIRDGLRILGDGTESDERRSGRDDRPLTFSALLPAKAIQEMYMYREIPGDPVSWIDPEAWATEIDMWVQTAIESRTNTPNANDTSRDASPTLPAGGLFGSIGAMVGMLEALPSDNQARIGIGWVEHLVASAGNEAAQTFALPEWLHDVRHHCRGEELDTWQRIVDLLYVHGDRRISDLAD